MFSLMVFERYQNANNNNNNLSLNMIHNLKLLRTGK